MNAFYMEALKAKNPEKYILVGSWQQKVKQENSLTRIKKNMQLTGGSFQPPKYLNRVGYFPKGLWKEALEKGPGWFQVKLKVDPADTILRKFCPTTRT